MLIDPVLIKKRLTPILGERVRKIGRAGNMLWLSIGKEVKYVDPIRNTTRVVNMYNLNIQTSWKLVSEREIIVGSADLYRPSNGMDPHEKWDWDESRDNYFDWKTLSLNRLFEGQSIKVERIIADQYGSFALLLNNQYQLHVFTDSAEEIEFWRFFDFGSDNPHFVVFDSEDIS